MARILFAHADPEALRDDVAYLVGQGHEVVRTTYGREAMCLLRESSMPHVLVATGHLPGADFFEILAEVHRLRPALTTQVIWITTLGAEGAPLRCWDRRLWKYADEVAACLYQPTTWQLVLAVEQLLYRHVLPTEGPTEGRALRVPL